MSKRWLFAMVTFFSSMAYAGSACKSAASVEEIRTEAYPFLNLISMTFDQAVVRSKVERFNPRIVCYEVRVPEVYKYETVDDEKNVRHASPALWRQEAIERHQLIYNLTNESIAGHKVQANVKTLLGLMDKPLAADVVNPEVNKYELNDIVDQALGEIGDPLAAVPLMNGIKQDIAMNKNIPYEQKHQRHFWAGVALSGIHFDNEELRGQVEDFLINLNKAYLKDMEANDGYEGFDGLAGKAFDTPKTRAYLFGLLGQYSFQEDWAVIRILWGWQDPTVLPDILKVMETKKLDNMSFEHLLEMMASDVNQLEVVGLDREDVLNRIVRIMKIHRYAYSQYTFFALAAFVPENCIGLNGK